MPGKKMFDAVQTLRFMCFLIVFLEHAGFYKRTGIHEYGELSIMSVFLMMSGFLMVYSYINRELPATLGGYFKFSAGKIKKLYPLHVETAFIQLIIIIALYYSEIASAGIADFLTHVCEFIVNLCLMQAWVPDYQHYVFAFNGPSWFLSVMLFAYFMFPMMLLFIKKIGDIKKIIKFTVCLIAVYFVISSTVGIMTGFGDTFVWFTQNFPISRTIDFFLGCVVGYIYVMNRKDEDIDAREYSKGLWTLIEAIVIFMFYVGAFFIAGLFILGLGNIGKMVVFCAPLYSSSFAILMLMIFIWNRGYITKMLSWKPLVYLGNISMYTYLIHYIFTQGWASFKQGTGFDDSGTIGYVAIIVEFILTIVVSILYDKAQKKKAAKARVN